MLKTKPAIGFLIILGVALLLFGVFGQINLLLW